MPKDSRRHASAAHPHPGSDTNKTPISDKNTTPIDSSDGPHSHHDPDPFNVNINSHSTNIFPSTLIDDIKQAKKQQKQDQENTTREEFTLPQSETPPVDLSSVQIQLGVERVAEQKQRRRFRISMFICFFILLVLQHAGLAVFIYFAIDKGLITEIQPLLEIIVSATLAETYAIIRIMVKFIFSPGDFDDKKLKKEIR